jgi:hypothetical protein
MRIVSSTAVLIAMTMLAASDRARIGPSQVQPGPHCRLSCAIACDRVSCQGLNVAQCQNLRFSCRNACKTRC